MTNKVKQRQNATIPITFPTLKEAHLFCASLSLAFPYK